MPSILRFLCLVFLFPVSAVAENATGAAPDVLASALRAVRSPLTLDAKGLSGEGTPRLLDRARAATFIVVGEDHGFADVPRFVLALDHALGADAPRYLVAEIGPFAAQRVAAAASGDDPAAAARAHPGSTPFFEWSDDLEMARRYVRRAGAEALWGIDQEFVLSATVNLEALRDVASEAGRPAIDAMLERTRAADAELRTAGRPDVAPLMTWTTDDTTALRVALGPNPDPEAIRRIDALDQSATIYRLQSSAGYESNRRRSRLMKQQFMRHWNGATPPRRALMRLGAFHATRGLTPTGQFDIGNLASELAEAAGGDSLHVLVVAAAGEVNRKLPFLADESLRRARYDGHAELGVLGVLGLLAQAHADSWTLFDLVPLRANGAAREAGGADFARLVYGFDFVIVVPKATAARDVVAP